MTDLQLGELHSMALKLLSGVEGEEVAAQTYNHNASISFFLWITNVLTFSLLLLSLCDLLFLLRTDQYVHDSNKGGVAFQ